MFATLHSTSIRPQLPPREPLQRDDSSQRQPVPRSVLYLLGAVGAAILTASVRFVVWSNEQTQYLIWHDTWRFFSRLQQSAPLSEYLFHNVHVFALPNLVLYLDVVLASGTLRFLHLTTNLMATGIGVAIYFLLRPKLSTSRVMAVGLPALVMSVWISPANAKTFSYHILGIIVSGSLLFALLAANLQSALARKDQSTKRRRILLAALGCVVVLGFASLEVFAVVIAVLALGAFADRDRAQSTMLLVLLVLLAAGYALYRHQSVASVGLDSGMERHLSVVVRNSLLGLYGFVENIAVGHGMERPAARHLGRLFVLVELGTVAALGVRKLVLRERFDQVWRASLALSSFALLSCVSSAWLRYGSSVLSEPVGRYLPYGIILTIAAALICVSEASRLDREAPPRLALPMLVAIAAASLAALTARPTALGSEIGGKLEMPLFAQQPGTERRLGPVTDDPAAFRRRLHPFLESEGLSVFSSAGYGLLGRTLSTAERSSEGCEVVAQRLVDRQAQRIMAATVRHPGSNGVFALVDEDSVVRSFGFPLRPTWRTDRVRTLLPLSWRRIPDELRLVFVEGAGTTTVRYRACAQVTTPAGNVE